jgi:hypothetical protein
VVACCVSLSCLVVSSVVLEKKARIYVELCVFQLEICIVAFEQNSMMNESERERLAMKRL